MESCIYRAQVSLSLVHVVPVLHLEARRQDTQAIAWTQAGRGPAPGGWG